MQIEIDGVQLPRRLDAVNHHLGDAFECILCHMRGGTGGAGNGRHQFPAVDVSLLDKACQSDIDMAHDLEHLGTLGHRRPAAAMHEIVIIRLRRREGVGLVQKAANGDTGHLSISVHCSRVTLDSFSERYEFGNGMRVPHGEEALLRRLEPGEGGDSDPSRRGEDAAPQDEAGTATGRKLAKSHSRPGAASSSARVYATCGFVWT